MQTTAMLADREIVETLQQVATATITTILSKKGVRNTWMRGPRPLVPGGARVVGRAFTMRFLPAREDLATPESLANPVSTRTAIEAMPEGCICIADARGIVDAGIFGDILCARMAKRGIAALVTDGAVRDVAAVRSTGLPLWCAGAAAPPSVAALTFIGWGHPVGCGGVAVLPDDWIVADDDGAVVIPAALVAQVAEAATEQERLEAWILQQVEGGHELPGLYPPNAENRALYEATRKRKD